MSIVTHKLIVNGITKNEKSIEETTVDPIDVPTPITEIVAPTPVVSTPVVEENIANTTSTANTVFYDKNTHLLIINGKEKIISKHSAYLLDMLTTDN